MSLLPEPLLAVVIVGVIPLLWSVAIQVIHASGAHARPPAGMRVEAAVLVVMIAPVAVGAVLLLAAPLTPRTPLPALGLIDVDWEIDWAAITPQAVPSPPAAPASRAIAWLEAAPPLALPALAAAYLVGFGAAAFRLVRARVRLDRIAEASLPAPALGESVRLAEADTSPFASPSGAIVLPRALLERLPADDVALVVRHERAHLERGDPASFWALAWLDALFWFNPFVRRQTARCRLAAEMACDDTVVADAPQQRRAYAQALVSVLRHTADAAPRWAATARSATGQGEHKMRLARIMTRAECGRRRRRWAAAAAAGLLGAPLIAMQLACAQTPPAAPAAPAPASAPAPSSAPASAPLAPPAAPAAPAPAPSSAPASAPLAPPAPPAQPAPQPVPPAQAAPQSAPIADPAPPAEPAPPPPRAETAPATPPAPAARPIQDQLTLAVRPLDGPVLSGFGRRTDPVTGQQATHAGVDIGAPLDAPVVAPAAGRVTYVGWRGGYGRVVEMDHGGGYKTRYGHLNAAAVQRGDEAAAGDVIGRSGDTGRTSEPALHWEIWYNGVVIDPAPLLAALEDG